VATAGDVAAPSQMEQSRDLRGGMSQLVRTGRVKRAVLGAIGSRVAVEHQPSCRRSDLWIAYESERVASPDAGADAHRPGRNRQVVLPVCGWPSAILVALPLTVRIRPSGRCAEPCWGAIPPPGRHLDAYEIGAEAGSRYEASGAVLALHRRGSGRRGGCVVVIFAGITATFGEGTEKGSSDCTSPWDSGQGSQGPSQRAGC
jgi:hypothetical protein